MNEMLKITSKDLDFAESSPEEKKELKDPDRRVEEAVGRVEEATEQKDVTRKTERINTAHAHSRVAQSPASLICFMLSGAALFAADPAERANALVKPPHELEQRLKSAKEAAAKDRFADAIADLRAILDPAASDGFMPSDGPTARNARSKARRCGCSTRFRPKAGSFTNCNIAPKRSRSWSGPLREHDRRRWPSSRRRNFPSRAAAETVMLLAYDALDRGEPSDALAWLRLSGVFGIARQNAPSRNFALESQLLSLARADAAACAIRFAVWRRFIRRSRSAWDRKSTRRPSRPIGCLRVWAGLEKPPQIARIPAQSPDWPMFRGDAARNAASFWTGGHAELRWKVGTVDPIERQQFLQWKKHLPEEMLFLRQHLLVVGNLVLVRSPLRLTALDLSSGRQVWENPPPKKQRGEKKKEMDIYSLFQQRFWEDAAYSQLSSDGREVFLVDGLKDQPYGMDAFGTIAVRGGVAVSDR